LDHVLTTAVDATTGEVLQCVDLVHYTEDAHADGDRNAENALRGQKPARKSPHSTNNTATENETPLQARNLQSSSTSGAYRGWDIANLTPNDGSSDLIVNPAERVSGHPLGWHSTGSTTFSDTRGNNVYAQENEADKSSIPPNGYRPTSTSNSEFLFDFDMDFSLDPGSGENLDAVVTNIFFMNNVLHDVLYTYGFDEVSGNFQMNNYGRGGQNGDAVAANSLDGSGENNANMYTPSDGSMPRMRMYRWNYIGNIDRPSSLDGEVVAHEYGHGLSNRLTGGPSASGCLSADVSGGMGEGWSDYLALMLMLSTAEDFEQDHGIATWLYPGGIRAYDYTTNMNSNPFLFSDTNSQSGVHGVGTVWCTILFDMTADLVGIFGANSDIYQQSNTADQGGNNIAFQNVIDGMKLQPCNPDFLDARDAILLADEANYNSVHKCTMWKSFARRGLGKNAYYNKGDAYDDFSIPDDACPCQQCTDEPNSWMTNNNKECASFPWAWNKACNKQTYWVDNNFCQKTCFDNGVGYPGDNCCPKNAPTVSPTAVPSTPCHQCTDEPNGWMADNNKECASFPWAWNKACNKKTNWVDNNFCQKTCFDNDVGYPGDNCCQ